MYRFLICISFLITSICAFSQSKEQILLIRIPYADTIPQELIDSIYRQEGKYILSYHPDMAHLIPDLRCRLERIPDPCREIEVNGVKFNMMCVEGGSFMMGSDDSSKEKPMHQVTVSDFMIGETEVTQELWQAVMGSNPSRFNGVDNPVEFVSWSDCQKFIANINRLTGKCFRLPTEAEWEYAACGGNASVGYKFAGSDNIDKVGWYTNNSQATTHPVATKSPNELGIYDMSGNVWEWCQDWYGDYGSDIQINPQGSLSGSARVIRGGSWMNDATTDCRVSRRLDLTPMARTSNLGFRLVLDAHEYVDLGLSVMWATCNVGASAPEEYGDYFAWGEVEPKEEYSWDNYKWCEDKQWHTDGYYSTWSLTKYCSNSTYGKDGFTDGLKTLLPEDDAAHVNWGGSWRIPTSKEMQELLEYCTWEVTFIDGIKGYTATSKINNNSIFLPCAGFYNIEHSEGLMSENNLGRYWTNTNNGASHANNLVVGKKMEWNTRRLGITIRPVLPTDREPLPPLTPAKRIGVFSVAKEKQVSFSQGNLQYIQSLNHWRFANNQWDYTGERHWQNGQIADTVMYFGWSAKNSKAPWGISTSIDLKDYEGEFLDWGTNVIQGDEPNTWRTLSSDEFNYLLLERRNADELIGRGKVGDINGIVLLPDEWVMPEGLAFAPFETKVVNSYTLEQWKLMEEAGAVFLPNAGYFNNKYGTMRGINGNGLFRSNTLQDPVRQIYFAFTSSIFALTGNNDGNLYYAFPVRLVHDTIVPLPAPCEIFEVNGVTFNMMCVEGGTISYGMGDTAAYRQRPLHQITVSDFYLGQTEVTQELWQAIMGENPSYFQCDTCQQHPADSVSWNMVQEFIKRLNQLTGRKFRLPTETEWEFAMRGGAKSKGFKYAGSDNLDEVAWYGIGEKKGGSTHPVAQKRPNELGLYDMHGNLYELVHDAYSTSFSSYPKVNPTGAIGYSTMVLCGFAYYSAKSQISTPGHIGVGGKSTRQNWLGFRLALSDVDPFVAIEIDKYRFHMMHVEGEKYDYYIGQTEVTQGLWKKVMGYNNSIVVGDDLPVEKVSWDECQQFIQRLNEMTGLHFRLPTEAEWEYAARGGNRSRGCSYAGSNNIDSVGWYSGNSEQTTHAVASLMPNELGVYDMTGNVWEWCQDRYGEYLDGDNNRVIRGGSWYNGAHHEILTYRHYHSQESKSHLIGFRLVIDIHEYVDLGLSVMWATCNVGATAPEEYGDYFAWGEVEPKGNTYDKKNYKFYHNANEKEITKYCINESYGYNGLVDSLTILLPEDDVAIVNWGGPWRMPTSLEFKELLVNCKWTLTTKNGIEGYFVTSKINGNTIFLPSAGHYYNNSFVELGSNGTRGIYWSSDLNELSNSYCAKFLHFGVDFVSISSRARHLGHPIRPILPKTPKTYYYGLTDEQFNMAIGVWNMPNRGWGIADQSAIQGKTLRGIRLKVHTPGVLHIYKVPSLTETTEANFVKVATITATTTGVQDIDFDQPFYLGKDEYLVLCSPSDNSSLIGCYASKTTSIQMFYNRIGQSGGGENAQSSLMIDFY